jgi:hypothetical protein
MQLAARGFDARGQPITTAAGAVFASSDPATLAVSADGLVSPVFRFAGPRSALISARLRREEVIVQARTEIAIVTPATFDHGAVLLAESVQPAPIRNTTAAGIAFFSVGAGTIGYTITWSALSGPATAGHLHAPGLAKEVTAVLAELGTARTDATFGSVTGTITAANLLPVDGRPAIDFDALVAAIDAGRVYADVHTAAHPDGEVRGQLSGPVR